MPGYVIAADLIGLSTVDPSFDANVFRPWLRTILTEPMTEGTNSSRRTPPEQLGHPRGAARVAIAAYLGDGRELARQAQVFRGWLGDRSSYAAYHGDLSWQCDESNPVGIDPEGCVKNGVVIGGALSDDMRRGGTSDGRQFHRLCMGGAPGRES